jgi:hypothetical protein
MDVDLMVNGILVDYVLLLALEVSIDKEHHVIQWTVQELQQAYGKCSSDLLAMIKNMMI